MLPKSHRLSSPAVQTVLRSGARLRSQLLSCRFVEEKKGSEAFAAVVPLRVAKGAVARNKARRALYRVLGELPLPPVRAVLMLEKLPTGDDELRQDIGLLFGKMEASLQQKKHHV
ncbi:MAG TPA: ribonuclease P protein component [Candidatus Paceibacterota bacterium]